MTKRTVAAVWITAIAGSAAAWAAVVYLFSGLVR